MPVVWTDRHRLHEPGGEVWVGVRTPGTELPARAEGIREALSESGARFAEADPQPDAALEAVHDPELLAYLAGAWEEWEAAGLPVDPGAERIVPYLFPHPCLSLGDRPTADPGGDHGAGGTVRLRHHDPDRTGDRGGGAGGGGRRPDRGRPGARRRARRLRVLPPARPPRGRACFGGSCYLNNSAAAAARLREVSAAPVAVIDVDAHHGNGTQAIFYDDPTVLVGSVHVDPGAGWFPHFLGFAEETGSGAGDGANRNLPIEPGSGDQSWLEAVGELAAWTGPGGARALVVALGVDAAGGDPESPLAVTENGFRAAGRALGALGLPTVVVQEGGYDLARIGALVREALLGIEEGHGN